MVPGWFPDMASTKTVLIASPRMVPGWFRDGSVTVHAQKQHCLQVEGMVLEWFQDGSAMVPEYGTRPK